MLSTIWDFGTNTPEYAWAEGTSMATPHVSGIAALVLSQAPVLTAADLRARLSTYAVGPASSYGAGLVNAYNSLTSQHGPPTGLYARLYAANTGAIGQTVAAGADGHYQFSAVEDGEYFVYAGTEEDQDHAVGTPEIEADQALEAGIGIAAAKNAAIEAQHLRRREGLLGGDAGVLDLLRHGSGVICVLVHRNTIDVYRLRIPAVGSYTFETSGWVGACGLAIEEATAIALYDHNGQLLTYTDFIDQQHLNYCSRLSLNLNPGAYFVGVAGAFGYRYRLQARAGS